MKKAVTALALLLGLSTFAFGHGGGAERGIPGTFWARIKANTKQERTALVNAGFNIDSIVSDSVYGTASSSVLEAVKKNNFEVIESFQFHDNSDLAGILDFPANDSDFHNYKEINDSMISLVKANPSFMRMFSIGKTTEGRDIWCVQLNSTLKTFKYERGKRFMSGKPGVVFMGNHHAREHVSAETPLRIMYFLANNYGKDQQITKLVDSRDIYFIPMVNPDGVEYDISGGRYHMHRKNMKKNHDGTFGVDLNRNYGYKWGTGGSSNDPSSDIYMGTAPFSEPETQAIRKFVDDRPNLKVLLSFHTYSELILYPWGHTYDPITDQRDQKTFEAMAGTMAKWNRYKPQQSSDLYITSGDTTDWAYGEKKIFAFTFELSPANQFGGGGFYPGQKILDKVFQDNLKPALYLIDLADNPYRAIDTRDTRTSWLD